MRRVAYTKELKPIDMKSSGYFKPFGQMVDIADVPRPRAKFRFAICGYCVGARYDPLRFSRSISKRMASHWDRRVRDFEDSVILRELTEQDPLLANPWNNMD